MQLILSNVNRKIGIPQCFLHTIMLPILTKIPSTFILYVHLYPFKNILHIKNDIQLPGNLTDGSVILDTVQLPVKNHLFLDVSSDDLYLVGGDRE